MSTLEILAAVIGAISVYLSVRQNIWSWPTAIVNVLLYTIVFYEARLYADMGLQVIYAVLSVYGWYEWLHGGENRTELHVTRTGARVWAVLLAVGVAGALLLGGVFHYGTDAAFPFLDSALASWSLVAQWMMTRKLVENWLVWIAVDVVYVPLYAVKQLYPTAVLYAVFLVLAVKGWLDWRRSMRADAAAHALAA